MNISKIVKFIASGYNQEKRFGLELEHIVCRTDYEPATYEQVASAMECMVEELGAEVYQENGKILGFFMPAYSVSLEPGCQIEISIAPTGDLWEIESVYWEFRRVCESCLNTQGLMMLEAGVHPLVESGAIAIEELPLLPRKRYEYMDKYFQESGNYGQYMMRATASTQLSLDYESEEDAMRKMRIMTKLSPLLALLTETPGSVGRTEAFAPYLLRSQIWKDVDSKRCGYAPGSLATDYRFQDYARYIYETPCILLQKNGETIPVGQQSAKDYYGKRELDTVEHLLSMVFPMVRLKKYLEYRVADSMPIQRALGYAALLGELFYNSENLGKIEARLHDVTTIEQVEEAEQAIMRQGYEAQIYGASAVAWLSWLLKLAKGTASEVNASYLGELVTLPVLNWEYAQPIKGLEEEHVASAVAMKDYLMQSTAKYHERVVRTLYLPKLYTEREVQCFRELVTTLYGIFDKVIRAYEEREDFRRLFGFSPELERLILRPKKYKCNIPIARIDIFHNDETGEFKFCEFNTDGTSAMNEDRELNHAFRLSRAYQEFAAHYQLESFELFDTWVDEVLEMYGQYCGNPKQVPHVAIVDFMEKGTTNEFEIFRQRFEERGIPAELCDIRKLCFDGQQCYTESGMSVDVIYRRAVTTDVMEHYDQVQDFIRAVESNKVCLLGDFRTQIVHNKLLFKVLHLKETQELLNRKERLFVKAHVPMTVSLQRIEQEEALYQSVMNKQKQWIVKPEDSYGSRGVLAGEECDKAQWQQAILDKLAEGGYILQEFVEPYRLRNIDLQSGSRNWITTSNLTGLFVYNEKFTGIYSRVSFEKMISTQYNEMSLPTMLVRVP